METLSIVESADLIPLPTYSICVGDQERFEKQSAIPAISLSVLAEDEIDEILLL